MYRGTSTQGNGGTSCGTPSLTTYKPNKTKKMSMVYVDRSTSTQGNGITAVVYTMPYHLQNQQKMPRKTSMEYTYTRIKKKEKKLLTVPHLGRDDARGRFVVPTVGVLRLSEAYPVPVTLPRRVVTIAPSPAVDHRVPDLSFSVCRAVIVADLGGGGGGGE